MNNDHFAKKLAEEREIVIGSLKGVGIKTTDTDADEWQAKPDDFGTERADPNDVADKIESYENNDAMVATLELRLREIDHALAKIEKGTFGLCEISGEPIEHDRLEANPAARTNKAHMNEKLGVPAI